MLLAQYLMQPCLSIIYYSYELITQFLGQKIRNSSKNFEHDRAAPAVEPPEWGHLLATIVFCSETILYWEFQWAYSVAGLFSHDIIRSKIPSQNEDYYVVTEAKCFPRTAFGILRSFIKLLYLFIICATSFFIITFNIIHFEGGWKYINT